MYRKLLMCVALVLGILTVTARGIDITGDTADTSVRSDGGVDWSGSANRRIGGSDVDGNDTCVVYVFELPTVGEGNEITVANLSFYFEGFSFYTPQGNADLHGIPYRSSSSVQSSDWYQGAFDGDPNSTGIQDDIMTSSSSVGTINTSSSGDSALRSYLNAQYSAGASGGDYVFIRVNADIDETYNHYWVVSMADHGTESQRPILTVTIGTGDTDPPSPNPMTWATEPYSTGDSSISMTATTATDASGVKYYFDETSGNPGGSDSGWQDSTTYEDTGLDSNTTYSYKVKARDKSSNQNETGYSTVKSATTDATDTTPPSPNPMTWATEPYATGTTSISMTATTATDESGVEYYFDETSGNPGGSDSNWQDSTTYEDTGLDSNTTYSYKVKARDKSTNQNETGYSTVKSATTDVAGATTFYVDPVSGSMSNDGSESSPWSTLEAVFDNDKIETKDKNGNPKNQGAPVKAGDTLLLLSGYHGDVYESVYFNDDYITIEAATGATAELKRFRLSGGKKWIIRGLDISPSHAATFERVTIVQFYSRTADGICSDMIVEDCNVYTVADSSGWTDTDWDTKACTGITLGMDGGTGLIARNNYLLNVNFGINLEATGALGEDNIIENFSGDGIRAVYHYVTAQYNLIKNCYNVNTNHDDGIQTFLVNVGMGDVNGIKLIGNIVINTSDPNQPYQGTLQGLGNFAGPYEDFVIENNLVLTNHWHGITLQNSKNGRIVNNTVFNKWYYDNESDMETWIEVTQGTTSGGNLVRNNIAHTFHTTGDSNVTADNNLSFSRTTDDPAVWFVDYSSFDMHAVDANSPQVDAGSGSQAPDDDIEGNSRPSGSGYDIGCYEYVVGGNISPVADAGADQTVVDSDENGSEIVSLDGSGSYDPDGTIESYVWKEDGQQIATGSTPNVVFDVNYHEVTLEVTDNNSATGTDTVIIIVNTPTAVTSTSSWQNFSIANQTGSFTFELDSRPNGDDIDGVTGVCKGDASAYSDLACIFRFNQWGYMDVRNGGVYDADVNEPYSAGTNYHVRMEIDISSHTYSVYVTPEGSSEVTLATDYAFRTEQGSVTSLDRWTVIASFGSHMVDNAEVTSGGDTTPPSPDPMTWATEPYSTGTSSISMTATTATDASGVEYYFDETSGNPGGSDSGWQDGTTYEDTGLDPNTQYTYKVKACDKSSNQNETAYSTSKSAATDPASEWNQLTSDDFESGWGSYTDGGGDCRRYTGTTYAHQGSCAIDIQDNSGVSSSFYYTNGVDVNTPGYTQIKVEFWYYPRSMESGEDFWVQYYDGSQWHTVATFVSGTDFSNDSFYEVKDSDVVIDSSTYDFPTDMKIRFMCDASNNTDDVYIDEVKVSAK